MKRTRLRRQSRRTRQGAGAWAAVYAEVDARSRGRCEVALNYSDAFMLAVRNLPESDRFKYDPNVEWFAPFFAGWRCSSSAIDHQHTIRPRRSNHHRDLVMGICRPCHDWADFGSYQDARGKLVQRPLGGGVFWDKESARAWRSGGIGGKDGQGTL